jgi:hypothetical protein
MMWLRWWQSSEFRMYAEYVLNYEDLLAVIDGHRKSDPSFQPFLDVRYYSPPTHQETLRRRTHGCVWTVQDCKNKSGARLDLESYLIQPVQRMPRYELLLKALTHHFCVSSFSSLSFLFSFLRCLFAGLPVIVENACRN